MGWAGETTLALVLCQTTALANPQRPADRPPTVFALEATGNPAASDFAESPAYVLGDATFRFLWSGTGLHVHVAIVDDDVSAAVTDGDDPAAAAEDSIELHVDALLGQAEPEAMTRVVVSAAGGVYDSRGVGGAAEDPAIDRAIVTSDATADGWETLVTIDAPSAMIRAEPGEVLGFDFAWHDLDAGTLATTDWSGLADLTMAECWSRVELVGAGDPPAGDDCIGSYSREGDACLQKGSGCAVAGHGGAAGGWLAVAALLAIPRASRRPGGWRRRRTR